MSVTPLQLIQDALTEIGAYSVGNAISAADAQFALTKLNNLLDQWNAEPLKIYAKTFTQANMITGLGTVPLKIGPTAGNWMVVSQRPEKILAANVILNNASPTNFIRQPLNIRDAAWWAQQRTPQIQTSLPTDVYYNPSWPDGQLYIWPVPTVAYPLELELWGILTGFTSLTTPQFSMPPAYYNAVMYSLAIMLSGPFRATLSPSTIKAAQLAIATVENMNSTPPAMSTNDSGIPKAERNRSTFNYHTGSSTSGNGRG